MSIILKELEALVKITRLFHEINIASLYGKTKLLRLCNCSSGCDMCDNVRLVITENRGTLYVVPTKEDCGIKFRKDIDYSNFNDMYNLYLLYKCFMKELKENDNYYIAMCRECGGSGEVLSNKYKDRLPQKRICPVCNGSTFVLCAYESFDKKQNNTNTNSIDFCNG